MLGFYRWEIFRGYNFEIERDDEFFRWIGIENFEVINYNYYLLIIVSK